MAICINPYFSGLLHWHWANIIIAPVPVKQPWRTWLSRLVPKHNKNTRKLKTCTCNFWYVLWEKISQSIYAVWKEYINFDLPEFSWKNPRCRLLIEVVLLVTPLDLSLEDIRTIGSCFHVNEYFIYSKHFHLSKRYVLLSHRVQHSKINRVVGIRAKTYHECKLQRFIIFL